MISIFDARRSAPGESLSVSERLCTFVPVMVKAIVFDLGGVLIDLDFDRCVRAFREILGYERITEILELSHQKGIYGTWRPDSSRRTSSARRS